MSDFTGFEAIKQSTTLDMLPSMCGLKEKDFATMIGVSKSHWYHMKKGDMPVTPARRAMFDSIIWMYYHEHSMLLSFAEYRLMS